MRSGKKQDVLPPLLPSSASRNSTGSSRHGSQAHSRQCTTHPSRAVQERQPHLAGDGVVQLLDRSPHPRGGLERRAAGAAWAEMFPGDVGGRHGRAAGASYCASEVEPASEAGQDCPSARCTGCTAQPCPRPRPPLPTGPSAPNTAPAQAHPPTHPRERHRPSGVECKCGQDRQRDARVEGARQDGADQGQLQGGGDEGEDHRPGGQGGGEGSQLATWGSREGHVVARHRLSRLLTGNERETSA